MRPQLLVLACCRVFWALPDRQHARRAAGKVCADDERAGADHSGGLRCPSSLCGGWGRGVGGGLGPPTRVRVWAAASGMVVSRVMGGDRVGGP